MSALILIVEDEPAIHELLTYNLAAEGFRTRVVEQGEDVHPAIMEEMPDLVLMDWMLPGLSGIEVVRMLRAKPETQSLPVIMLTARGEEAERLRGLLGRPLGRCGAIGCVRGCCCRFTTSWCSKCRQTKWTGCRSWWVFSNTGSSPWIC